MKHRFVKTQKTSVVETDAKMQSGSPYVDWCARQGQRREPLAANPDMLAEGDGMYAVGDQQVVESVRELVGQAPQFLTGKQYETFVLMSQGLSARAVARRLGCSQSLVTLRWQAAKAKLQKAYNKIRLGEEGV